MKPLLILLLDRGYNAQTISELTGVRISRVYYAQKKYIADLPRLKEILNAAVTIPKKETPAV